MELQDTIGITGGIGSGKSVVSRILRCNGYTVYDCDTWAKILMQKDLSVMIALKNLIGEDAYFEDGSLNKPLLAEIIFSDQNVRESVNGIVHAAVKNHIIEERKRVSGTFFVESAILASSGIAEMCNWIWLINCPLEERINRIKMRDGLSEEAILSRIQAQEKELHLLPENKTIKIENGTNSPVLTTILNLKTKEYTHVKRNFGHNREARLVQDQGA